MLEGDVKDVALLFLLLIHFYWCDQVLSSKMLEQETKFRQLSHEQLDNFTLDMNTAYARLKGVEEAIDSKICASAVLVNSKTPL